MAPAEQPSTTAAAESAAAETAARLSADPDPAGRSEASHSHSGVPADVIRAASEDPDVAQALAFCQSFEAQTGIDYGWVLDLARDQYRRAEDWMGAADSKAAGLIGYLGGATGLLAVGSGAAVSAGRIDPLVGVAALPAFVAACLAVMLAALSRRPRACMVPPSAQQAAERADHYCSCPELAAASLLGSWQLAAAMAHYSVGKRAWWLRWATPRAFVLAIALLLLPLIVAIVVA